MFVAKFSGFSKSLLAPLTSFRFSPARRSMKRFVSLTLLPHPVAMPWSTRSFTRPGGSSAGDKTPRVSWTMSPMDSSEHSLQTAEARPKMPI